MIDNRYTNNLDQTNIQTMDESNLKAGHHNCCHYLSGANGQYMQ